MLQRSAKSYQALYKQLCKNLNVPTNQGLKNGISDGEIIIYLEQINQCDLEPLYQLMSQCKFKSIVLRSMQKNLRLNKSTVHDSFRSELLDILKVITKLFTSSLDTLQFTIRDIRLSQEHMLVLAQGITVVRSLKELSIIQCLMTTQLFSFLQPALTQNSSLVSLDLSHNFLTSQIANQLVSILTEHSKRRSEVEYVYRLRQEDPEEDISMIGICNLNLSHNRLNDGFVKDMMPFLERDRWLRKISIKYNQISKEGLEMIIEMLDKNCTLIDIEVRHNLGVTQQLQKELLAKLARNKTRGRQDMMQKQLEEGDDNILANVSAIPTNLQSQLSYDQESPVMSFGVFEKDGLQRQISINTSKTDGAKLKSGLKNNESGCPECYKLTDKVRRLQLVIARLLQENQRLESQLKHTQQPQQQQQQHNHHQQQQQQNILKFLDHPHSTEQEPQEDMIDLIINELTRVMDSLDAQGSVTNNLTAHLSSTIIGQNNNTRVIFEREDRNEQLMNILEQTSPNQSSSS